MLRRNEALASTLVAEVKPKLRRKISTPHYEDLFVEPGPEGATR